MPSELKVVELSDELRIQATRRPPFTEATISTVASGGFVALVALQYFDRPVAMLLVVCAASLGYLLATHRKNAELRVARTEFVLRGRVGDRLGSKWKVSPAEIQWLEYQEDTTGPESSHHPGGLYAVLEHRSVCLLPDLDERQPAFVIELIENRFPDFHQRWAKASAFGKHSTALRLNDPEPRRPQ